MSSVHFLSQLSTFTHQHCPLCVLEFTNRPPACAVDRGSLQQLEFTGMLANGFASQASEHIFPEHQLCATRT